MCVEDFVARLKGNLLEEDLERVDFSSIELDGIYLDDAPDFCDAFITNASFKDGIELTDIQIDDLNDLLVENIHEMVYDYLY